MTINHKSNEDEILDEKDLEDVIKQLSDRREMSIWNNLWQGGKVNTIEGMTTLMTSKN